MTIDFDPNVDYYKALDLPPTASADEIKKAYRKLAKANHPDSTGGDKKKEARFKEVSTAYEVLGNEAKRKQYDEIRDQLKSGRFRAPQGAPGPGGAQVWDLGDLFSQFFAQGQATRGGTVHFEVDDDGSGGAWPFGGGMGGASGFGRGARVRRGRAQPVEPEPPVVQRVRASDGSWLTVKGSDVHSDVRLAFQDAILGTVRDVATLDGTSSLKIPPGTSSGMKLRLRGKGVGGDGDHYVTVQIDVPKDLDDDARKLLHDLTSHLKGQAAHHRKKG